MISKEAREKALGQFRLRLNGMMSPFSSYGLGVFIPPTIEEIAKLALQLHERLNGLDVPIGSSDGSKTA